MDVPLFEPTLIVGYEWWNKGGCVGFMVLLPLLVGPMYPKMKQTTKGQLWVILPTLKSF